MPAPPVVAGRSTALGGAGPGDLDAAIAEVVANARPSVGRTRAVEILRGGRSQALRRNAYDGLPLYGAFAHLSGGEVPNSEPVYRRGATRRFSMTLSLDLKEEL